MSLKPKALAAEQNKSIEHSENVGKNESPKKMPFSNNLSPMSSPLLTPKRRPPLSKLASLPFRYAFDGFSNRSSSNQLTKQNTIPSPTNTNKSFVNEKINSQQHFSSSSLSGNGCGRCSSSHNGDYSASEVEISEENLHMRQKKQNSISSSDMDDFKSSSISNGTNQQVWESKHNLEEEIILDSLDDNTSNSNNNNQTLPTLTNLKKYSIRRHHSAPQSDSKWLQV
jgi:hypothetical protein